MSLQPTPPAAPTHPVSSVAKAPARHAGSSGAQGHGNGGVSPFAQLLQGLSDDVTPDAGVPTQAEEQAADDHESGERPVAEHEAAHKAHDKTSSAPEEANATPQQPASVAEDTPATQRAASLGNASLLAAARAKAGVEARGRAAAMNHGAEDTASTHGASLGQLGANDAQTRSPADQQGLDISAFKPTLDAATVNLAPAEAATPVVAADFSLPSLGTTGAAQAAPEAPPAPPAQATLAPPPGSAAFPAALGAQLSTWLKDGVQYASLELNPQDMGPIGVRIAMRDGRTRVELGADVAATRQALSEALPALAEALGDVGLSLSGGSVSDQTSQHARQGDAEAQRAFALPGWLAPARDEAEAAQAAAPQRAQRGLIDLVA